MKITYALFVFIAIFTIVSAYTTVKQNAVDPKKPNQCYDKDTKKYYNVGNNPVPGKCERAHCSLNDHELTYTGCTKVVECSIKRGDSNKQYPDCCDKCA